MDKQEILAALDLAIADHKTFAANLVDWDFVSALQAAKSVVADAPEVLIPEVLVRRAAA